MTAAATIQALRGVQARATDAITGLMNAGREAHRVLAAALAAFDAAGCSDDELTAGVASGRATLAGMGPLINVLELARDCCDSLAGDLETAAAAPQLPVRERYEAAAAPGAPEISAAVWRALADELEAEAAAIVVHDTASLGACLARRTILIDRARDCRQKADRCAYDTRATLLQAAGLELRRVRTTGADVHAMGNLIHLVDEAAALARKLAELEAGGTFIAADDWRTGWLAKAEAQLVTYRTGGLAAWIKSNRNPTR